MLLAITKGVLAILNESYPHSTILRQSLINPNINDRINENIGPRVEIL